MYRVDEIVEVLTPIELGVFAEYLFRRDPLGHKVPVEQRNALIAGALACGLQEAEQLKTSGSLPTSDTITQTSFCASPLRADAGDAVAESQEIERYLIDQGVTVTVVADAARLPGYVELARYVADGPGGSIEINGTMLQHLESVTAELGLTTAELRQVILAHELFHHFETHSPEMFTQQAHIPTWKLFGYQHYNTSKALSEIAATAFAQKLTGLTYSPNVIEIVAAQLNNPELGEQLVNEVRALLVAPLGQVHSA